MAVMWNAALHNRHESPISGSGGWKIGELAMGFLTEMFSRPRPHVLGRVRAIEAISETVGAVPHISDARPADFPRRPRSRARL
jgi:hypothetical protein